ncbi:MAG: deoxynucleoside kinase [Calditrichaeota bacterium]|jgi:deoxyguanosine kinase|nr:deoxynucleoside kinase [Calditrichota bacterium]MBT7615833.1 deoxynucleoside kinase [Calditrichota bacterium]MBT7789111.1 deoxynucleoside kinase [Calditrichota bacterium]
MLGFREHIAIEGPIGAGKTTLATILSRELGAQLVLEQPEDNPFLPDYYKDRERWALQTQLIFLLSRHREQLSLKQLNMFQEGVVTDYIYEKDAIFAKLALDEREYSLYSLIADRLAADIINPSLIVYLQSTPERLMTNIRIRDREYERDMSVDYIKDLCELYNRFFSVWDRTPVLIVRTTEIDFVGNEMHRLKLVEKVKSLNEGRVVFDPEE